MNFVTAFACCLLVVASAYKLKVGNFPTEGQFLEKEFVHNDSVVALTTDICAIKDKDFCFTVQDKMSYSLYGVTYTPILPHATVEDYYSNRTTVIKYLRERYNFRSYLEVGCGNNATFAGLAPLFSDHAVGVDPYSGGTLRLTSDAFFAMNTLQFDLIFIDGLHDAVQVLKDVDNALRVLSPGGVILIHDCHPHLESYQLHMDDPNLNMKLWTGNVWKAIVLLKLEHDLDLVTGDFDMGLAVVKRRNNQNRLPLSFVNSILALPNPNSIISELRYELLAENREEILSLRTIAEIKEWL